MITYQSIVEVLIVILILALAIAILGANLLEILGLLPL